jgi:hypothetical protein
MLKPTVVAKPVAETISTVSPGVDEESWRRLRPIGWLSRAEEPPVVAEMATVARNAMPNPKATTAALRNRRLSIVGSPRPPHGPGISSL